MGKLRVIDTILIIIGIGIMSTSKILNGEYALFNSYLPGLLGFMVASSGLIQNQAQAHADKIDRDVRPIHWKATILRAVVSVALCCLLHLAHWNLLKIGDMLLFSIPWIGLCFNFELNIARHLPMFYLTKEKKHAAWTDRLFNFKHGGEVLALLQILAMVFIGYIYCIK